MRTFSRNQDVQTVKLKSEFFFIYFFNTYFFHVLADPKLFCLTQMIPSMYEPSKEAKFW